MLFTKQLASNPKSFLKINVLNFYSSQFQILSEIRLKIRNIWSHATNNVLKKTEKKCPPNCHNTGGAISPKVFFQIWAILPPVVLGAYIAGCFCQKSAILDPPVIEC